MSKSAPQISKIREFREAMNMSQAAVAELANTSQSQIVKLEKDQRKITKAWAQRLAPILGVHAARILFSDEELAEFRGIAAPPAARPWKSALAEAIALSRKQGATPQCVHAELQHHLPLTTEQAIALIAQRPRIQQELALQVSERLLQP